MTAHTHRSMLFDVVDDHLVRTTVLAHGCGHVERCPRAVFEATTHAIEDRAAQGVTLDELAKAVGAPLAQVAVALDFLQEHGCVEIRLRRSYPASNCLHEDAMAQYLFLAELPY